MNVVMYDSGVTSPAERCQDCKYEYYLEKLKVGMSVRMNGEM